MWWQNIDTEIGIGKRLAKMKTRRKLARCTESGLETTEMQIKYTRSVFPILKMYTEWIRKKKETSTKM